MRILLYVCPRTLLHVSAHFYVCVLIRSYPHTLILLHILQVVDEFCSMLDSSRPALMDTWRLDGHEHMEPKKLAGAASLGADSLRHIGA